MKALIHVQDTCIWLGSLAGLAMAISLLEPSEIRSVAGPKPTHPIPANLPQEASPEGIWPWWDSPRG